MATPRTKQRPQAHSFWMHAHPLPSTGDHYAFVVPITDDLMSKSIGRDAFLSGVLVEADVDSRRRPVRVETMLSCNPEHPLTSVTDVGAAYAPGDGRVNELGTGRLVYGLDRHEGLATLHVPPGEHALRVYSAPGEVVRAVKRDQWFLVVSVSGGGGVPVGRVTMTVWWREAW